MRRLTVRDLTGPAPDRDTWLADAAVPGLYLRCLPTGARSFVVRYRHRGRQRKLVIGRPPVVSLTAARRLAADILRDVSAGRDPAAARAADRTAPTVADLWRHVEAERLPALKPSSSTNVRHMWGHRILPALGSVRLAEMTRSQVLRWHRDQRDAPVSANRALGMLRHALDLARLEWGLLDGPNPADGVRHFAERPRRRYATRDELRRLAAALERPTADPRRLRFRLLVWLLLLTGCRVSELLRARWSDVDRAAGVLILHDAKAGPRDVRLTAQAVRVLDELRGLTVGSQYLFPGETARVHLRAYREPWARLCKAAGIAGLHVHDLRRTTASIAISDGRTLAEVGGILGHRSAQATARYAWLIDDVRDRAVDSTAAAVERALRGAP